VYKADLMGTLNQCSYIWCVTYDKACGLKLYLSNTYATACGAIVKRLDIEVTAKCSVTNTSSMSDCNFPYEKD